MPEEGLEPSLCCQNGLLNPGGLRNLGHLQPKLTQVAGHSPFPVKNNTLGHHLRALSTPVATNGVAKSFDGNIFRQASL